MNKKGRKREDSADSERTIAELFGAIEELESRKRQPGEGILAVARELAAEWKIKNRPLFEGLLENKRLVLLVALVVALMRELRRLEQIRRHFPNELEDLISASSYAEFRAVGPALVAALLGKKKKFTPKQQYDRKRSVKCLHVGEIEHQFGYALLGVVIQHSCLDEILAGRPVNMIKLQRLFGIDRHLILKILPPDKKKGRGVLYGYHAVIKILETLLSEPPRKHKTRGLGRPPRMPWLNDSALRAHVLGEMERRVNSLSERVPKHIKSAFLAVIRCHLPGSGKK